MTFRLRRQVRIALCLFGALSMYNSIKYKSTYAFTARSRTALLTIRLSRTTKCWFHIQTSRKISHYYTRPGASACIKTWVEFWSILMIIGIRVKTLQNNSAILLCPPYVIGQAIIYKKIVKQQCLPRMSSQYGELRSTSTWNLLASLGHPSKVQLVSRLGSVTARHSSSGRQPNFAALNRGRHLCLAGRSSRWALAHISSSYQLLKIFAGNSEHCRKVVFISH